MGGSSFDPLLEELQQLQHVMQELERTNQELRRQLANLRMGKGIVVDIAGKRFMLSQETTDASASKEASPEQPNVATTYAATPLTRKTTILPLTDLTAEKQITHATLSAPEPQETPAALSLSNVTNEGEATFLEEIMYDEFANQMTSPMSVWTGPVKNPETPDEAQKAALRRELMGSFLLE